MSSEKVFGEDVVKNNLPPLNEVLLNQIFDGVYGGAGQQPNELIGHEPLQALIDTLYAMQRFNHRFRPDDTGRLFDLFDAQFNFERNSEGTTLWLALILAVQELYGLSDSRLMEALGEMIVSQSLTHING
ncbi:MAG: hypothetical protein PHD65_07535 [Gallionella sp.]|nr:hypothetical protein [Gallionella sp.]